MLNNNVQKMSFSVVISVYKNDNLEFLKEALNSVIFQTLRPDEIVIVVDGPVEKKVQLFLKETSDENDFINIIFLKDNRGLANALNIGVKAAKHDIIARMDSDDICFLDRFEKQIDYLKKNNIDVLGGQMLEFESDKRIVKSERKVPFDHDAIIKRMKYLNPFSHPTVVFKKEVFNKLNGYNTNMFPEDYDFFVRASLKGFKLANLKDSILYYRLGDAKYSMYQRRRGLNFAKKEFKLYKNFYSLGFYSLFEFLFYSLIKIPVRLLPTNSFKLVYNTFVR